MVVKAYNAVTWENEAGALQVQELHGEKLSQKQANIRRKEDHRQDL